MRYPAWFKILFLFFASISSIVLPTVTIVALFLAVTGKDGWLVAIALTAAAIFGFILLLLNRFPLSMELTDTGLSMRFLFQRTMFVEWQQVYRVTQLGGGPGPLRYSGYLVIHVKRSPSDRADAIIVSHALIGLQVLINALNNRPV